MNNFTKILKPKNNQIAKNKTKNKNVRYHFFVYINTSIILLLRIASLCYRIWSAESARKYHSTNYNSNCFRIISLALNWDWSEFDIEEYLKKTIREAVIAARARVFLILYALIAICRSENGSHLCSPFHAPHSPLSLYAMFQGYLPREIATAY